MAQLLREPAMNYHVGDLDPRNRPRDLQSRPPRPGVAAFAWDRRRRAGDRLRGAAGDGEGAGRLLDVIDRLERSQVRHKVLVVGEGPARDWFEQRCPNACFAGFQEGADLGRAVASMDMLLNPSVTETFGNVTLEAMAVGLPVVAAIATGSQSLVTDRVTGRLIRAGAIEEFAEALTAYCRDEQLRQGAGRAGMQVSLRYGWDEVNQELVDAYLRVIRQRGSGRGRPGRSPVP
jgi:glycogen synthase